MAQYQEWLHYHEVDRHLQAQLAELVNELAQLQEHAHVYEQDIISTFSRSCCPGDHSSTP